MRQPGEEEDGTKKTRDSVGWKRLSDEVVKKLRAAPQPGQSEKNRKIERDSVFCTSVIDQELHRSTLVQRRIQALRSLVSLNVFWQPVCCPGESRSPRFSLRSGAASSSQSTRSGVRYQETVYSQDVKISLIVCARVRVIVEYVEERRRKYGSLGEDRSSRSAFG